MHVFGSLELYLDLQIVFLKILSDNVLDTDILLAEITVTWLLPLVLSLMSVINAFSRRHAITSSVCFKTRACCCAITPRLVQTSRLVQCEVVLLSCVLVVALINENKSVRKSTNFNN